jgi:hypothetical protein
MPKITNCQSISLFLSAGKTLDLATMKNGKYLFSYFFILLICLLSFRFVFFISYIELNKSDFKEQLKLSQKQLTELEFSARDLYIDKAGIEWKENNNEVVINGVFYEIIQIKKTDQKIIVSVIADKKENELFQNYFAFNKNAQSGSLNIIKLLLTLNYVSPSFEILLSNPPATANRAPAGIPFTENDYHNKSVKPPEC